MKADRCPLDHADQAGRSQNGASVGNTVPGTGHSLGPGWEA